MDIEFDARPSFMTSQGGQEYTPKEREELYSLIGEQGLWKSAIQRAMRYAKEINYQKTVKAHRRAGYRSDEFSMDYMNLRTVLQSELNRAKRAAEAGLSNAQEIRERVATEKHRELLQRQGKSLIPELQKHGY